MTYFAEQLAELVFDLEQVKTLASPVRGEVFWTFSGRIPMSAAEVAKEIGKSPQSVHHHVGELLKAGLLLAVDERKKHARTETLYVRKGVRCVDRGYKADAEYLKYRQKAFAATMRILERESALHFRLVPMKPEIGPYSIYARSMLYLTAEEVAELEADFDRLVKKYRGRPIDPALIKVHLVVHLRPTVGTSRKLLADLGEVDETEE
jgi:DNA-binding transcriptional ArsR family regulator